MARKKPEEIIRDSFVAEISDGIDRVELLYKGETIEEVR